MSPEHVRPYLNQKYEYFLSISFRDSRKQAYIWERWVKFPENDNLDNDFMSDALMDDSTDILTLNELMAGQRVIESELSGKYKVWSS